MFTSFLIQKNGILWLSINNQNGFSLIELLVVISIIGTLANTVTAATSQARRSALDADFKNDVRVVAQALELYANDNGHYRIPEGGAIGGSTCDGSVDGSGIGFLDIKNCVAGPGQNYDPEITILDYLKREGYLPDNALLEKKEPPGIDAILYLCNGAGGPTDQSNKPQSFAIYTSLFTADPVSEQIIDQGKTCGVWSPSAHTGNYVIFSDLVEGLTCAAGCCGDGPGC